jgi:abequosyltransferase
MKNRFLLSIAIPTFNRATYLDDALKQLASELSAVDADLVEVLVSDNASSDHTAEIVAKAVQRGMAIRYICNAENVGADANVAQCFNEAQGQYVMIMGDDDLFVDGALAALLGHLQREEYGMVCLKAYGFESDFRAELPASVVGHQVFDAPGQYLIKVAHLVTLLSACVINKSLLPGVDARLYCGSFLVQVHLCVTSALRAKRNLFVNNYQIAVKRNNSGGYDHSRVFVTNLLGILDGFVGQGLTANDIRQVERRMLLSYLPFYTFKLLIAGGDGLAQAQQNLSARFEERWLYRVWLKPAFYLPGLLGVAWAAAITVIGRIAGGDLVRGFYYLKNRLKVKPA